MGFLNYLQLGFEHISDLNGYDHILFIIVMCVMYQLKDWKKIIVLVTAFTLGHSLTLALSSLNVISVNKNFAEFLISVTILLTALWNVYPHKKTEQKGWFSWNYLIVLFFGLIHGLGFSNYFKMMSFNTENLILGEILPFNIGVEIGQLIIVFVFMIISYFILNVLKINYKKWVTFVSGAAFGISLILIKESTWIEKLFE